MLQCEAFFGNLTIPPEVMNSFGHGMYVDRWRGSGKSATRPQNKASGGLLSLMDGDFREFVDLSGCAHLNDGGLNISKDNVFGKVFGGNV